MCARMALFGGAFDPIHLGHLELARNATEELKLDGVLLMPSCKPPHKGQSHATDTHRVAMCRLAVESLSEISVSVLELERHISYTADTLTLLHEREPAVEWTLLVGEDAFCSLPYWKNRRTICSLAQIAVSPRGAGQSRTEQTLELLRREGADVTVLKNRLPAVSSSQIRDLAAKGILPEGLIPPSVCRYIREHRLYQTEEGAL